jgi:peptidoglycan/LPS O-acetylase OafA/YrhL
MQITSADYWAVKNDYKPLMHTWSLGIEEQFYIVWPILLWCAFKIKKSFIYLAITVFDIL